MRPTAAQVVGGLGEDRGAGEGRREHLGLLRGLRVGLGAADADERRARPPAAARVGARRVGSRSATRRCGSSPSWVQRHTSSVANGSTGASRRSSTSIACAQRGDVALRVARVGALLHELEVVVAERPEELLGHLERAGVVVLLVGARSRSRRPRASSASMSRSSGSVTAAPGRRLAGTSRRTSPR